MTLTVALAQITHHVGNPFENAARIISTVHAITEKNKVDLIVFPELTLSGYPPEDLLLQSDFYDVCAQALKKIQENIENTAVIIGYPEKKGDHHFNAAVVLHQKKIIAHYQKQILPNYTVFDEKRYFQEGSASCVVELKGIKIGLLICEDIWYTAPAMTAKKAGAEILISMNASPYHHQQTEARNTILKARALETDLPVLYGNFVGAQDELIFDGGSKAVDATGKIIAEANYYEEDTLILPLEKKDHVQIHLKNNILPALSFEEKTYKGIQLCLKEYLRKNHFKGALIGLSGGIDSALTLAIAADTLGAENVTAIIMPSQYTAKMSIEDAIAEANTLNVKYEIISIDPLHQHFLETLTPFFNGKALDATEENLQARIRGMILMALSNKTGKIVLTTGNKSEMAVGYCTLYGDMAGGFAVIKDVLKTDVYRLARYRNTLSPVIPERVLTRAPTAELKHDQTDQDKLPPYDILDAILKKYIEEYQSKDAIKALGFDAAIVDEVITLLHRNEYKRRQAPIGPRLSARGFGKDWRWPMTQA